MIAAEPVIFKAGHESIQEGGITRNHDLTKPQGVRGRNSDNTTLNEVSGWQPEITISEGIRRTYLWIAGELSKTLPAEPAPRRRASL